MKKLFNKKGFTLAELLIVVAIIGVLTVVAVPVFTTQLEKSKVATDEANMRAAKAEAVAVYLADNKSAGTAFFDAANGKLTKAKANVTTAYGKSGTNKVIQVTFAADTDPVLTWLTAVPTADGTYTGTL